MNHQLRVLKQIPSSDGSAKYIFGTHDGFMFEGVSFLARGTRNLCLSSQIGCAYSCNHCATGALRWRRNLTAVEIVEQAALMCQTKPYDVLLLGMGEPFLNIDPILASIDLMIEKGAITGRRNVLIGSSGTPGLSCGLQKISVLADRPLLCFSIHGVPDDVRVSIIPHTRAYGLKMLRDDIQAYQTITADDVTLNYNPLHQINDSDANFEAFAAYVQGIKGAVRIIPWNPIPNSTWQPSSPNRVEALIKVLENHGVRNIYRPNYCRDIFGGCGQLGFLSESSHCGLFSSKASTAFTT